jgi:hypothetical protein
MSGVFVRSQVSMLRVPDASAVLCEIGKAGVACEDAQLGCVHMTDSQLLWLGPARKCHADLTSERRETWGKSTVTRGKTRVHLAF